MRRILTAGGEYLPVSAGSRRSTFDPLPIRLNPPPALGEGANIPFIPQNGAVFGHRHIGEIRQDV